MSRSRNLLNHRRLCNCVCDEFSSSSYPRVSILTSPQDRTTGPSCERIDHLQRLAAWTRRDKIHVSQAGVDKITMRHDSAQLVGWARSLSSVKVRTHRCTVCIRGVGSKAFTSFSAAICQCVAVQLATEDALSLPSRAEQAWQAPGHGPRQESTSHVS